jgi:hypothetical protein
MFLKIWFQLIPYIHIYITIITFTQACRGVLIYFSPTKMPALQATFNHKSNLQGDENKEKMRTYQKASTDWTTWYCYNFFLFHAIYNLQNVGFDHLPCHLSYIHARYRLCTWTSMLFWPMGNCRGTGWSINWLATSVMRASNKTTKQQFKFVKCKTFKYKRF